MPIKNPKELFVMLLSDVRFGTEKVAKFFQEIIPFVQDPEIKQAVEARLFINEKILATLDQCFKLIGEQPIKPTGRLYDIFLEDFKKEFQEIQLPVAKHLFILAKINHLINLRIGEYMALITAADMTGHYGVAVLLESCLADKLALVERTKKLIRNIVETKIAERVAA
jgi:ferritin-like metal-binding protein YciE